MSLSPPSSVCTLLDFNGVLLDDEGLHHRAFAEAAQVWGFPLSWETYLERYLAYDDEGAAEALLRDAHQAVNAASVRELLARKQDAYDRLAASGPVFFAGAKQFVEERAACGPVVIVSGAWLHEIEEALQHLGVRDRIVEIVSAERTQACKPDPEGYHIGLAILERTQNASPRGHVVAVEDSPGGVRAARAAQVPVVAVTHTVQASWLRDAGAAHVGHSLAELTPSLLANVATSPWDG